jgi:hypothetical protein
LVGFDDDLVVTLVAGGQKRPHAIRAHVAERHRLADRGSWSCAHVGRIGCVVGKLPACLLLEAQPSQQRRGQTDAIAE